MATISCQTLIKADPDQVWDAVRDYGAIQTRLAPGVVSDTQIIPDTDPPVRKVTFVSGQILHERIIAVDDDIRRLVWSIEDPAVQHHNGSLQVFAAGSRQSRVTWIADVLPHSLANDFEPLMQAGLASMNAHLSG
jgi:carbon monoxide dehydrogenase subunit G